jgi:hypothetical protein
MLSRVLRLFSRSAQHVEHQDDGNKGGDTGDGETPLQRN